MHILYASSFRSLSLCCYIAGGYPSPDSRSLAEHFELEFSPLSAEAAQEYQQQQVMRSSVSNSNSSVQQPASARSTAASSSGECNIQYWIPENRSLPGSVMAKTEYSQQYWLSLRHFLLACVTDFVEVLLSLAIENAGASMSTQLLIKVSIALGT